MYDRQKYLDYLKSPAWKALRHLLRTIRGDTCSRCSKPWKEVHHKTYKNLFNEKLEDLECLCSLCHRKHHKKERQLKVDNIGDRMPFGKYKGKLIKYIIKDDPSYIKFIYPKCRSQLKKIIRFHKKKPKKKKSK